MYKTIASALGLLCQNLGCIALIIKVYVKQEGHLALNRSPEFCLKLTYRYYLKIFKGVWLELGEVCTNNEKSQ